MWWFKKSNRKSIEDDSPNISDCEEVAAPQDIIQPSEEIPEPSPKYVRSLSTPIDIVLPKELRPNRSALHVSDEELEFEIQKVKSMKNNNNRSFETKPQSPVIETKPESNKKPSPVTPCRPTLQPASPRTSKQESPVKCSPPPVLIKCSPQKTIVSSPTSSMAHREAQSVEQQFQALEIAQKSASPVAKDVSPPNDVPEQQADGQSRPTPERDSANHSPSDVMLASPASPSARSISDSQSEGSNDSGKGGSDVATPPPRTPANEGSVTDEMTSQMIYEFTIPQYHVGRLIGRGGSVVQDIKSRSRANIMIKKHPHNPKLKICAIEGGQSEIDAALQLIRERFPIKKYPDISMEQILCSAFPLTPDQCRLKLVEGINNDTVIAAMCAPNHYFVQQPTHPTFPNLNVIYSCMNDTYNSTVSPIIPFPIAPNSIVAAYVDNYWQRVMVLNSNMEDNTSQVVFLDYGGYGVVNNNCFRQLRFDFMYLPFQAIECQLANIKPVGGVWTEEAFTETSALTNGALCYTQVVDYNTFGTPLVYIYIISGPQNVIYLNQELVDRGFAEWVDKNEDVEPALCAIEPTEAAAEEAPSETAPVDTAPRMVEITS